MVRPAVIGGRMDGGYFLTAHRCDSLDQLFRSRGEPIVRREHEQGLLDQSVDQDPMAGKVDHGHPRRMGSVSGRIGKDRRGNRLAMDCGRCRGDGYEEKSEKAHEFGS